jgi:hypothetical protein
MKALEKITDYKDFTDLLIQQYKDKEKFVLWQKTFADECNKIEDAIFEMMYYFNINNGFGIILDIIGKIIGLSRNGRNDESYKTLLKIKAEINFGSGTPEAIIKTVEKLYNATQIQLNFIYPAKIQLWQNGDIGLYNEYNMELDDGGFLELDDENILEIWEADDISENLLYSVLPSGVDLLLAYNLILDANDFMELDDGGFLIIT